MAALPFANVGNESELNQDLAAIAGGTGSGGNFTLNADLLAGNLVPTVRWKAPGR